MDMLARREHSRLELFQKLSPRASSEAILHAVLDTLQQDNLLNEERFCEAFIRSRFQKGQGPVRIRFELRQRGIEDSLIDNHLFHEDLCWAESLMKLVERKFGRVPASDLRAQAKQQRFLQSRGFTFEQIQVAFEQLRS